MDYGELHNAVLSLLILLGLGCLLYGGDKLSNGAANLAQRLKINPLVVGLTVVSFATSTPEFFTTFFASFKGNPGLGIGNIVGSNIANIGLILGVTTLIYPIAIQSRFISREAPFLLAVTFLFAWLSWDGKLDRFDGVLLVLVLIAYLYYLIRSAKSDEQADTLEEGSAEDEELLKSIAKIVFGAVLLGVGAEILVGSAVVVATRLEVSQVLIGITVVAIGTSLPELGASIAAARQKQSAICAGNIVGSNLFNLLFVGGGVSVVFPLDVDSSLFDFGYLAMIGMTCLLWFVYFNDRRVGRIKGGILLALYVVIIALSVIYR